MHSRILLIAATTALNFLVTLCPAQQTPSQKRDTTLAAPKNSKSKLAPGYTIPIVDISGEKERQVIVDREAGQYLGHPTTVLLEDGKTMLIVYPKGHGRGAIVYKRSSDGGKTWSDRLPTPPSWATSLEVPTLHRVVDAAGKKRIIMFSGLYPIRMAVTEDDGATWSELKPIGEFGGVVTMATVIELKSGPGHYLAFFHDDGRFIRGGDQARYTLKSPHGDHSSPTAKPWRFWVYTTLSTDGGLTWSVPAPIAMLPDANLCEPGVLRSPDGKQIAVLLRENSRKYNSFVIFSNDEGLTWTEPRELPAALTGDRHVGQVRARRPPLHQLSRHHPRQPHQRRLGRLGRHLRGHRQRPRRPVSRPHHGQHQGGRLHLPGRRVAAGRHLCHHDLRPLDRGGTALHRERAVQAGGAGSEAEALTTRIRARVEVRYEHEPYTIHTAAFPQRDGGGGRRSGGWQKRPSRR